MKAIGNPAVASLIEGLKHTDATVRWYCLQLLVTIEGKEALPDVIALLDDPSARVRRYAAAFAGKLGKGSDVALAALRRKLNDKDPMVVNDVLDALAELADDSFKTDDALARRLCGELRGDNPDRVQETVRALGKLGNPVACGPLIEALRREPKRGNLRLFIAHTLARINSPEALPGLLDLLTDPHAPLRARTVIDKPIRTLADPAANNRILPLLRDPERNIRRTAALALGFQGNAEAVAPLVERLTDDNEDDDVRRSAVTALGRIGDPEAAPALIRMLKDEKDGIRRKVARALGNIHAPEVVPALVEALNDKRVYVIMYAAESLGHLGDRQAAPALLAALNREQPLEAVAAAPAFSNPATVIHLALARLMGEKVKVEWIRTEEQLRAAREHWAERLKDPRHP